MSQIQVVTGLTGTLENKDWNFNPGKVAVELDPNSKKVPRGIQLSREGICFYRGTEFLGIPTAELWKLADSLKATLVEKPKPEGN